MWHSWSPQEQNEYQECDKNSMFGKLGSVDKKKTFFFFSGSGKTIKMDPHKEIFLDKFYLLVCTTQLKKMQVYSRQFVNMETCQGNLSRKTWSIWIRSGEVFD